MQTTTGAAIGIGILSFITTNVDDFLLLLFLFSTQRVNTVPIVVGQVVGISLLITVSYLISFLGSQIIPRQMVGILGIVPLIIGISELIKHKNDSDTHYTVNKNSIFMSTTLLTLSGGGDNIAIYVPLFIEHSPLENSILIGTFLVMAGIWCYLALRAVQVRTFSKHIRRFGKRFYPIGLITIGIYILFFK